MYWIAEALFVDIARFWWALPFAVLGLPAMLATYVAVCFYAPPWRGSGCGFPALPASALSRWHGASRNGFAAICLPGCRGTCSVMSGPAGFQAPWRRSKDPPGSAFTGLAL
jgi:hypothetical protein